MNKLLVALGVTLVLAPSSARAEPLSEQSLAGLALAQNPAYAATAAQVAQALASLHSAQARYDSSLTLDAGATRTRTPSLSVAGGVLTSTQLVFNSDAILRKKLVVGTEFTLTVGATWQRIETPFVNNGAGTVSVTTPTLLTTGPGYALLAKAAVVHPLLRGSGRDVGLAAEREARSSRAASIATRERTASELLRDALSAYWELWYADAALTIQRSARDTSKRQRDEAAARRDTGSLAPADVYTFETELAQAEESLVQAETEVRARAAEVARLIGRRSAADLHAEDEPPSPGELEGDLVAEVMAASPELAERRAELTLAEIRARTADDSYRSRLDLDAYAQLQGLGNRDAGAAVSQFTGLDAFSVHVGLTYELPLQDRRRKAEADRAQQSVLAARHALEASTQRLLAQLDSGREKLLGARRRASLAASTVTVARASVTAEEARFRTGSSTPIAVVRAQDQLRSSELRLARARVDLASQHVSLLHLTGRLLRSDVRAAEAGER